MELHSTALVAAALLLLTLLMMRFRQRGDSGKRAAARREDLDTVAAWPPESVRVMTVAERQSYDLLRNALPGFMVLAQVPLSRFVRVPSRHSYLEWMQRVGGLSADLVVCDSGSRVLAAIDVRTAEETERARRRHERLARVLKAAGVKVYTWRENQLPTPAQVRALIGAELGRSQAAARASTSRPMPLIPVPVIEELLAHGDAARYDAAAEPVPSAFFDDEPQPATSR